MPAKVHLLPRHGHVHYASDTGDCQTHALEVGDLVYLNYEGHLFAVTVLECGSSKCLGAVTCNLSADCHAGEVIEFGEESIYVIQKKH